MIKAVVCTLTILFVLASCMVALKECGGSDPDGPDSPLPITPTSLESPVVAPLQPTDTVVPLGVQVHGVGDMVQVGDYVVVLNSAVVEDSKLQANLTIENKGMKDLNVSSLLDFEARDSNGTELEMEWFGCGSSDLGGMVISGDKLRGDLCWEGVGSGTVKIYYRPELFGSSVVIWEIVN